MRRKPLILASLAAAVLGSMLLIDAYAQEQDPCSGDFITVPNGTCRAVLVDSRLAGGEWIFTILGVKGKMSKVDIQIYESALPTSGMPGDPNEVYAVCSSIWDPYGRVQATCGLQKEEFLEGRVANAGRLLIKRVTKDATASITLDEGLYCVRPCAYGSGEVAISVLPPKSPAQ